MRLNQITRALDTALPQLGLAAGHQVSYSDGLPTTDDGLAFFTSQLSAVETKLYQVKYRNIVFQDYVPVDTDIPEWADSFTYFAYDGVTMGKFIGADAKDLPEADINAAQHFAPLFYGGNAYSYTLDELRKSQQLNMPLDTTKAALSYRGFQEHAQQVAFFGDASRRITGLLNNANVPISNIVIPDINAVTGPVLAAALNNVLVNIWLNSNNVVSPNIILLPSALWAKASSMRMEVGTDTTVLEFFRLNNNYTGLTGQPLVIMPLLELQTAGVGGVPRIVAYELNEENLTMKMPMPWRSIAPQPEGLRIRIPAEYKFGGVEIRYPGAFAYADIVAS